jgi:hypothetical protein
MRHLGIACTVSVILAGCGGSPSQPAPPPAPARASLSGTVIETGSQRPAAAARIDIIQGVNQGAATTADAEGRYRLDNLELGSFTVRAQANGFEADTRPVTLAAAQVVDFALRPSGPPGGRISGTLLDGLTQQALAGARVRIDGLGETTSGADGSFSLAAPDPETPRAVIVSSGSIVERTTRLRVPGPATTLTLIPSSLDLAAFNQMFRGSGGELHRWVAAPALIVERRVLQFTTVGATEGVGTATTLTDSEVSALVTDLEWALGQLTAGAFTQFSSVRVDASAEGATVRNSHGGAIHVARYDGLTAGSGFWGYARWSWNGLGEMQSGLVMLDRNFEVSGSPYRRSLRAHELGHALGYQHVTTRDSVMQSHARTEPTAFDRDGARIAFQRMPRNRAPDVDPDNFVGNLRALAAMIFWAEAH